MDTNSQKPEVIKENSISDRPVCPYITDCRKFDFCNQPDLTYLSYIIKFCGYQFVQCQYFRDRLGEKGLFPKMME
jgi:hypothetical protein